MLTPSGHKVIDGDVCGTSLSQGQTKNIKNPQTDATTIAFALLLLHFSSTDALLGDLLGAGLVNGIPVKRG